MPQNGKPYVSGSLPTARRLTKKVEKSAEPYEKLGALLDIYYDVNIEVVK